MKLNLPYKKYLFGILATSLFFLLMTTFTAGLSGLLFLVGDTGAGSVLGWIAAFLGLIFFGLFFLLAFSFFGLTLLPIAVENQDSDLEEKQDILTK